MVLLLVYVKNWVTSRHYEPINILGQGMTVCVWVGVGVCVIWFTYNASA